MKSERRLSVLTIIINSLGSLLKIIGGLLLNSYTLLYSGFNTLVNDINDFISFMGSVLRGRRASSLEPFGFGKNNLLPKLVSDIFIIIFGAFLFINAFFIDYTFVVLSVLFVIVVITFSFIIWARVLYKESLENRSEFLMDRAHSMYIDGILTIVLLFFTILGSFMPVFDLIGALFGSVVIIIKGLKGCINTIILIKGQNDQSKLILRKIKKIIDNNDDIKYLNATLINVASFYKIVIEVSVDESVSLGDLIWWEEYIRGRVIEEKLKIRLVDYLVYKKE